MQVVRVDISAGVNDSDRQYILRLCDNADVTMIIKGLTAKLTPTLWTWEYLLARCGHVVWKKVRVFEKKRAPYHHQQQQQSPQEGSGGGLHHQSVDSEHWHERGWKTMSLQVSD